MALKAIRWDTVIEFCIAFVLDVARKRWFGSE